VAERVPVNGSPFGTIDRAEHDRVWRGYAGDYGTQQSSDRIIERGGFGLSEIVTYLGGMPQTWQASARTPVPRRPPVGSGPQSPDLGTDDNP